MRFLYLHVYVHVTVGAHIYTCLCMCMSMLTWVLTYIHVYGGQDEPHGGVLRSVHLVPLRQTLIGLERGSRAV